MKRIITIFVNLLTLCLLGCSRNHIESGAKHEIIVDVNKSIDKFDLSTILASSSDHEIIILETNDDCLLGEATRIFFRKDKIFIFDEMSKSVFCFNDDGSYNYKIAHIGRGPNEYIDVCDVYVSDDAIFVFDNTSNKILSYDLAGQFLKAMDSSNFSGYGIFEKDGNIYLLNYWWGDYEGGKYRVFVFDRDGNLLKKELPFNKQDESYGFSGNRYSRFSNFADVNFGDIIYRFADNGFIPQYHIDFGNKTLPREYYPVDLSNLVSLGLHKKYILGLENMYESDRFLLFDFYFADETYYVIYDKHDDETVISKSMNNTSLLDISLGSKFFIDNNDMYSYYYATDILVMDKYSWEIYSNSEAYKAMKAKISGMTEMDNGLIIRYKLKTDED